VPQLLLQRGNMPPNGRCIRGVKDELEVVLQVIKGRFEVTKLVMQESPVADFGRGLRAEKQ
jgi:hypothetical protein